MLVATRRIVEANCIEGTPKPMALSTAAIRTTVATHVATAHGRSRDALEGFEEFLLARRRYPRQFQERSAFHRPRWPASSLHRMRASTARARVDPSSSNIRKVIGRD